MDFLSYVDDFNESSDSDEACSEPTPKRQKGLPRDWLKIMEFESAGTQISHLNRYKFSSDGNSICWFIFIVPFY